MKLPTRPIPGLSGRLYRILPVIFMLCTSSAEGTDRVHLPEPRYSGTISLEETLYLRRSTRSYKNIPLSLEDVSQLLWAGGGKNVDAVTGPSRTAPSAGGIYPIELYIVAGAVNDLPDGIYRYSWRDHTLIPVKEGDFRSELGRAALFQSFIAQAPVVIILTGQFQKTERKYGSRGIDRYVPMDAGHTAGNISLQATALNLGITTVGAFNDSAVSKILELEDKEPLYILPVGKNRN